MNKIFLISLVFLLSNTMFAQKSIEQPSTPPYEGYKICLYGKSDKYMVYGKGGKHGKGFYYQFNGWKFLSYNDSINGEILDVMRDAQIITIRTDKDKIFIWDQNNQIWFANKGITGVKDFGRDGNYLYVIGSVKQPDGSIKKGIFKAPNIGTRSSDWIAQLTNPGVGDVVERIDISDRGILYAVSKDGKLYSMSIRGGGTPFKLVPGVPNKILKDVYICGEEIYVEDNYHKVFRLHVVPSYSFVEMKYSGQSWAVSESGTVYGISNGKIEKVNKGNYERLDVENPNRILADGNTLMTKAIKENNAIAFDQVIKEGGDVNAVDKAGDPPIIIAVKTRNNIVTDKLISNKADVNKLDKQGYSALYYACKNAQHDIMSKLLENGADPNQKGVIDLVINLYDDEATMKMFAAKNADLSEGYMVAAEENSTNLFLALTAAGVKQNGLEPFKKAVENSSTTVAGLCIDNGANADEALKYALEKNNKPIIEVCLEKGANPGPALVFAVNNSDIELCTQLMNNPGVGPDKLLDEALSTTNGPVNTTVAELAIQSGADVNKHIKNAVESDQNTIIDLLLKNGADPNLLLTESVNSNKIEYAQLAISKGASIIEASLIVKAIDYKNKDLVALLIAAGGNASDPVLISKSVSNNDIEITRLLISYGASTTDPTLILMAVNANNLEMTRLCIENGASASDPTLIKTSVTNKKIEISKLLIMNGASCTDPSLINIAVTGDDFETSRLLLENGAVATDPSLIMAAVKSNNTPLIILLIDNNAPVSGRGLVSEAAGHNNMQVVTLLVEKGADATDGIETAVSKDYANIALYLLNNGADATDPVLMQQASRFGNLEVVTKLYDKGADVNNGTIPAIESRKADVLAFLVDQGATMTTTEYMYKAVSTNNENIFEIVEGANAPNSWTGSNGDNLLHFIARNSNGSAIIINKLANGGVDINAINNDGDTPLLVAVKEHKKKDVQICRAIVEAGADVTIEDKKGKTPKKRAKGKVKDYLKSIEDEGK